MGAELRAPLRRVASHLSPLDTPAEVQPTGLGPLAGHSNGHDSAPLPAADPTRLHHSLTGCSNSHSTAPLPATDTVRFFHPRASHDNGHRSTPCGRLHVARFGDATGLLYYSSQQTPPDPGQPTTRRLRMSLSGYCPPPIKGGPKYVIQEALSFLPQNSAKFSVRALHSC